MVAWWWLIVAAVIGWRLSLLFARYVYKLLGKERGSVGAKTLRGLDHDTLLKLKTRVNDEVERRALTTYAATSTGVDR